jgi:hypothetical protein
MSSEVLVYGLYSRVGEAGKRCTLSRQQTLERRTPLTWVMALHLQKHFSTSA